MATDLHAEARRLFDELIEVDSAGRAARLHDIGPDPAVTHEVSSLLAAAARAGDFSCGEALVTAMAIGSPVQSVIAMILVPFPLAS